MLSSHNVLQDTRVAFFQYIEEHFPPDPAVLVSQAFVALSVSGYINSQPVPTSICFHILLLFA